MVTLAEVWRLALALPEATEQDHHGFPSFRVGGKIFATVPDDQRLNVMVDADRVDEAVREDPRAHRELWWGKRLSGVQVALPLAEPDTVVELLTDAWRRKAPARLARTYDGGTV